MPAGECWNLALLGSLKQKQIGCYGAAPTKGQRSLVRDQRDLVRLRGGREGGSPHRLIRRLERKCGLDTKDST